MIIGINGYASTGKDTVADVLIKEGFSKESFAELLKKFIWRLNPQFKWDTGMPDTIQNAVFDYKDDAQWRVLKDNSAEVRRLLQMFGQIAREEIHEDVLADSVLKRITPEQNVVLADMRFPNEFRLVKERGGITVRINRPGVGPVNDHISEVALDNHDFDIVINNDASIEELEEKVYDLIISKL